MTTEWGLVGALGAATFVMSLGGSRAALQFLRRRQIVDNPNERSSHTLPTPRGLGLGVAPAILVAWIAAALLLPGLPAELPWVIGGAVLLGLLSWVDDLRNLPAWPRLVAQIACVIGCSVLLREPRVFEAVGLGDIAGITATTMLWVGLINQVNFTDGIDGHLGGFLLVTGLGLFVVSLLGAAPLGLGALALTFAAAAAGFLPFNWSPAKAFMGDVGSVPLGFLVGWLLLRYASAGQWSVVIVLPLFYFADTAVTYSAMIARRERFWRPHRNYLYQRVARVIGHGRTVGSILACEAVLLAIVIASLRERFRWVALVGLVPVVITYAALSRRAKARTG